MNPTNPHTRSRKWLRILLRGLYGLTLLLGIAGGVAAAYLTYGMLDKNWALWAGFGACAALVLFVLSVVGIWKWSGKTSTAPSEVGSLRSTKPARRRQVTAVLRWTVLLCAVLIAAYFYRENQSLKAEIQEKEGEIAYRDDLLELETTSENIKNFVELRRDVKDELDRTPGRRLRAETIHRIAAASQGWRAYKLWGRHARLGRKLSPARGMLLLELSNLSIDSTTWAAILAETSFEFAELYEANLKGKQLAGARLRGADLGGAQLQGANLDGADLSWTDLSDAVLDSATLRRANLLRALLNWAQLNDADLQGATLSGAFLRNAQLRRANLHGAIVQWAKAEGALLMGANLTHADLLGSHFLRTNLRAADLTAANLMAIQLEDARLQDARLDSVRCGKDFLDKLEAWRIAEAAALRTRFAIVDDSAHMYVSAIFRLEKTGN